MKLHLPINLLRNLLLVVGLTVSSGFVSAQETINLNKATPEVEDWGDYGSYTYDFENVNLQLSGAKKLGDYDYQGIINWTASENDVYALTGSGTLSSGQLYIGAEEYGTVFEIGSSLTFSDIEIYAATYYAGGYWNDTDVFTVDFDAVAKSCYFMIESGSIFDINDAKVSGKTWMMIQGGKLVVDKYTHTESTYMELVGDSVLEGDLVFAGKSYNFTGTKYYDEYDMYNSLFGCVHVNWTYYPEDGWYGSDSSETCACLTITGNLSVTSKTAVVFYGGDIYDDSSIGLVPQTSLVVFKCGSVNEKQLSLLVPYLEDEVDEECSYCLNFDWEDSDWNWRKCSCKYGSYLTYLSDREFLARAGEDGYVHVYLGWKRDANGVPGNAIRVAEGQTVVLKGNNTPTLERPAYLIGGTADARLLDDETLNNINIMGSSGNLMTSSSQTMSFLGNDEIKYNLVGGSQTTAGAAMLVGNADADNGSIKLSGEKYNTDIVEVVGGLLTVGEKTTLGRGSLTSTVSVNGQAGLTNFGKIAGDVVLRDSSTMLNEGTVQGYVTVAADAVYVNNGVQQGTLAINGDAYGSGTFDSTIVWAGGTLHVDNESGVQKHASLSVQAGGSLTFLTPTEDAAPGTDTHSVLQVSSLSLADDSVLDVSGIQGRGSFTLIKYGSFTGNLGEVTLSYSNGTNDYNLTHDASSKTITLNVTGMAIWNWSPSVKSGVWQNGTVTGNPLKGNATDGFVAGDEVVIASEATVTLKGNLAPSLLTISADKNVTLKSLSADNGHLTGSGQVVVQSGAQASVTFNDGNTYTGGTIIDSGIVNAGGADSFGSGDITLNGGTLDLKGKLIDNDISLEGSAVIKGADKYTGDFSMSGAAELMKGSVVNIGAGKTVTLSEGTINGTLSGKGSITVDGVVSLGPDGKLAVDELAVAGGELWIGSKGYTMKGASSCLSISDWGVLYSDGKLSLNCLRMESGELWVGGEKPQNLDLTGKGVASSIENSYLYIDGALNVADSLTVGGSSITVGVFEDEYSKPQSLTVKGSLVLQAYEDEYSDYYSSSLNLNGKLSAGKLEVNSSYIFATGSVTVTDSMTMRGAEINLGADYWANPQSLTVKNALYLGADEQEYYSSLSLSGKLSAGKLVMEDASIFMWSPKPQSIALTQAKDAHKNPVENVISNSSLTAYANMSVSGSLTVTDSTVNLNGEGGDEMPVATSLSVKDAFVMNMSDDGWGSSLNLSGKLSAGRMDLTDAYIELYNYEKAQSIALTQAKDASKKDVVNLFTNSYIDANASMSVAGSLHMDGSHIWLYDASETKPKAMGLTVKGNLVVRGGSSITLTGALSAKNLELDGGIITLDSATPSTIKVGERLTIRGESFFDLSSCDFVAGRSYKLITFKNYTGVQESGLYAVFGIEEGEGCILTCDGKSITLTIKKGAEWNPTFPVNDDQGYALAETRGEPSAISATAAELNVREKKEENDADEPEYVALPENLQAQPDYSPVADALVQSSWGLVETSRAFVNTIANRSMAVQLGDGERAVWASAIGGASRRSSSAAHYGADTTIAGGAIGMETQLGESSLLGMALGNSWTRVSAHGFGTIKQDTTHVGLYGQTRWSVLSADWSAAYGRSESRSYGSSWNQQSIQLDARLNYNHSLSDNTVLRGFAGAQYYGHDSATVDGIETGKVQNLRAEIGVGIVRQTEKNSVYAEVALLQDVARHNPEVRTPDGQFYRGLNPGRTGVNITVGGSYALSNQWSLNASYTAEFVENANMQSVNVGATYKF